MLSAGMNISQLPPVFPRFPNRSGMALEEAGGLNQYDAVHIVWCTYQRRAKCPEMPPLYIEPYAVPEPWFSKTY
jgi:hypothetical protein